MKRNIEFVARKYDWGWSVWISVNGFKTLLANKLASEQEVDDFIQGLSQAKVIKETPSGDGKKE